MRPTVLDETRRRLRPGRGYRSPTRALAAWIAVGLLQAEVSACRDRPEKRVSPAPVAGETSPVTRPVSNVPGPARDLKTAAPRTPRSAMLSHYADTSAMRHAVVAGKLLDYQAAAARVARDDWAPSAAPDAHQFTERARAAAAAAQAAPTLVAAARALGTLGDACAACHLASGALAPPIAPEEAREASNPHMLAHAIASDRLWAGLTLPSDESWASGVQLLRQDSILADSSLEVSAAARYLNDLTREAERTDADQRGRVFADVLLTCSGCHERLGVVLEDGKRTR